MTLTKADMADRLCQLSDQLNKNDAKEFVDSFFEEIRANLEANQCVKLSSFGNFITRDKQQRPGRNPKTKDPVMIAPRRVVTFHAGKKLKARIVSETKPPYEKAS
jgi:integration host factor subunit alpha